MAEQPAQHSEEADKQQDVDAELKALFEALQLDQANAGAAVTNDGQKPQQAEKDAMDSKANADKELEQPAAKEERTTKSGKAAEESKANADKGTKQPAAKEKSVAKSVGRKRAVNVARKPVLVSPGTNGMATTASVPEASGPPAAGVKSKDADAAASDSAAPPAPKKGLKVMAAVKKPARKIAANKGGAGPKIKKSRSAYIFFCNDKRAEVKAAHPDMSMTDMSKELGVLWKALSDTDKKPYQDMAGEDKQRAQKENEDAGLGTPAARKAARKAAGAKVATTASDDAAVRAGSPEPAEDSEEGEQASPAAGAGAQTKKAKRKLGKESKPSGEAKRTSGIDAEDMAERMAVDWQAHPAECIISQTRDGSKYVVKRTGLGYAEFGLVDARAAKRQRAESPSAEATPPPLPLELVDEYERFTVKFQAAVHDHTEDGELDLEDLARGSLLDQCSFLGYMREEAFPLNRADKGRDTTMRVPTLGLSLLVQRMVGLEAARRAEAEAEARRLRIKVKELELALEKGKLVTAGEE